MGFGKNALRRPNRPPEIGNVVDVGAVWRDWEGVFGSGGRNCLGRVVLLCIFPGGVCLRDVFALRGRNDPPATESPSREGEDETEAR